MIGLVVLGKFVSQIFFSVRGPNMEKNCQPVVSVLFTARCYASVVLAMALCPSVRQSVRHKPVFY